MAAESYSVVLLPLQHTPVPSETVPKDEPDALRLPSQQHADDTQPTEPMDTPADAPVEIESPRNLPPPESADLVQHTPGEERLFAPPNPGVDTISAEIPEISAIVLSNLRSNYWSEVYTVIAKKLRYPTVARMQGLEGDVTIQIRIDSDGHLQEVNERETSARMFSRAVLTAAQRAVPYPSPPEQLQTPVELEIPISFRLDVR